jgi:HKD family nuclease
MIGELVTNFGEDEPGWWVLIITALFLAVLHLGKSALLENAELSYIRAARNQEKAQREETERRDREIKATIKNIEDEKTRTALETIFGIKP